MSDQYSDYASYLRGRSWRSCVYRRVAVYPRIDRRLQGQVLDIGCGIGDFLAFRKHTVGTDVNPHCVGICKERGLEAVVMQPGSLPFDTGAFDGAVLDNVLEHIADPTPLLAETHRVVRARGTVVAGVPGTKGFSYDPDHKRFFALADLDALFLRSGFERVDAFNTPFRSDWLDANARQYCQYAAFRRLEA